MSTLPINQIVQGNVLAVLKTLPENSIDTVMTSPPYWGLRHYGTRQQVWGGDPGCHHAWRDQGPTILSLPGTKAALVGNVCATCQAWRGDLGLEPYYGLFVTHLCDIFDEVRRVLKPTGTCWVNLGDTYAAKSLCQIPSRFAIEMTNRGWLLRNEIIWHKPNCIPVSVKDRFTVDFDKVYFFTKSKEYYFEMQYDPVKEPNMTRTIQSAENPARRIRSDGGSKVMGEATSADFVQTGRNKRTVWTIPARGFKEAHFATYPETLVELPLQSGCPAFVCTSCGKPREKIRRISYQNHLNADGKPMPGGDSKGRSSQFGTLGFSFVNRARRTIHDEGYTDCGCNSGFEPGIVLDPFMGSGTTAVVALNLKRSFVGIELNPEYVRMAERRIEKALKR